MSLETLDREFFVLTSPSGQNWLVRINDSGDGNKFIETSMTDLSGNAFIKIKNFQNNYHKIKVDNDGRLITYPMDSIG